MDPYRTLGVARGATRDEIQKAYRRLCREWHPDVTRHQAETAHARMVEINRAYDQLKHAPAAAPPHQTRPPTDATRDEFFGGQADQWFADLIARMQKAEREKQARAAQERARAARPAPASETPPEPIRWATSINGNPTTVFRGARATVFQCTKGRKRGRWGVIVNRVFDEASWSTQAEAIAYAEDLLRHRTRATGAAK